MEATEELAKGNLRARVDAADEQDEISQLGRVLTGWPRRLSARARSAGSLRRNNRLLFEETKDMVS